MPAIRLVYADGRTRVSGEASSEWAQLMRVVRSTPSAELATVRDAMIAALVSSGNRTPPQAARFVDSVIAGAHALRVAS